MQIDGQRLLDCAEEYFDPSRRKEDSEARLRLEIESAARHFHSVRELQEDVAALEEEAIENERELDELVRENRRLRQQIEELGELPDFC